MMLEKKFYQLRDALMKVRVSLLEGTANEFDFYRYLPKRDKELPENIREQIKRKFRAVFRIFLQRVRNNCSKEVETLNMIQDILTLRKFKQYELNDFKIDADITSDDQDLIKNTLIPIADIIKTRSENFHSFQKNNPKLFIDYYRKKALKSGAQMTQPAGFDPSGGLMLNHSQLDNPNVTHAGSGSNWDASQKKSSSAVNEAKLRLAETHEIPEDWETNIEKVRYFMTLWRFSNLLFI